MNLDNLNPKQRKAAEKIDGPLLVLAGAGSGKTSTMVYRIANMVDMGIRPYNILAVTFTNKAAGEMKERVESLVGNTNGMWIMTFHAMCLRFLKMHADRLGYGKNFVIYDTSDQKTVIKNICKEKNINSKDFKPQYLLSIISKSKEKEISPKNFFDTNRETAKTRTLQMVYELYERELKKNNAMDFDDLLLNALRLLRKNPDILEEYQRRFTHILVDEYQDTNMIQYELIRLLADDNHNLCVVGDDDQCIYQWRGADIRNILDFENDFPEAEVIKLEQNYRSTANIIEAAHSVVSNNRSRKDKQLWTEKAAGELITYQQLDSEREEALYIGKEIEMLVCGEGRKYRDFAILYRTNAQSRQFEEAFTKMGIPYRVLSGLRYYDRKEIKDILAYMRLLVNPKDNISMKRIINEPKRGMGAKGVEKLETLAGLRGQSIYEALTDIEVLETLANRPFKAVGEMMRTMEECRESEDLSVADVYDKVLVGTGYLKALELENTVEAETRIENLMEFKSVINDYEESAENPTVGEFMEGITLMADIDNHDETLDAVVLMTMHSAKGLEFPIVFMPGMEDGLFPGSRALDSESEMEEERRLCYVGMTRAKERLFMLSAKTRMLYGRREYKVESRFLREVDKKLITGDSIYDGYSSTGVSISSPGVNTGGADGYADRRKAYKKPFDTLGKSKSSTKRKAKKTIHETSFDKGDRVSHIKFGEGTVKDVTERTITVEFAEGTKKLAKGIAPVKKLK